MARRAEGFAPPGRPDLAWWRADLGLARRPPPPPTRSAPSSRPWCARCPRTSSSSGRSGRPSASRPPSTAPAPAPAPPPPMTSANAISTASLLRSFSSQGRLRRSKNGRSSRLVVCADAKEIAFDQKSRAALQADIEKLASAVGVTLGPRGQAHFYPGWCSQLLGLVSFDLALNPSVYAVSLWLIDIPVKIKFRTKDD
ncbi:uncharacterized protein LOC125541326 [Triticum urartu]|uniref:uncharacterized protein LOC125541326 n=1 Tax=Triticum urartu TaxID=4572 RepID=UPI0020437DE8|nr:uncharacterized protein LOC125541326 [Triticum urartu]